MDRKTLTGVALCILFLIFYRPLLHLVGWDRYMAPAANSTAPRDTSRAAAPSGPGSTAPISPSGGGTLSGAAAPTSPAPTSPVPAAAPAKPAPGSLFATPPSAAPAQFEQTIDLETPLYLATFSSRGARMIGVVLKRYASGSSPDSKSGKLAHVKPGDEVPEDDRVSLSGGPLFGIDLGSGDARRDLSGVVYAARESLDAGGRRVGITFTTSDSSGAYVRQSYRVRPDGYAIDLEVEVRGIPLGWRVSDYSLTVRSWPLLTEANELSDARSLRTTSLVGTNLHRDQAARLVGKPKLYEGNAAWAAVQTRYFVAAIAVPEGSGRAIRSTAVRRPLMPAEQAALPPGPVPPMEVADNTLVVAVPSELKPVQRFVLYAGPSEFFGLSTLKVGLDGVVDLGWTWIRPFSHAMLWLLKWLYGIVRNYGLAIILLATLVRLLLHPLNVAGLKSMRAMQKIQPELERIRDKYKDDPQALNTAMMALYRDNKVNPAGGCLPTVVQLPVFVSLYNVLFNAIELRQAPFVGWIHDLSAPDLLFSVGPFPIRLLPLLMLGTGVLSQRFTPSDPRQMPTMYLMNAFMTVFFYNLPSGLVLYWTLMNALTALQQWLVLRQHGGSSAVVVAEPPVQGKARKR